MRLKWTMFGKSMQEINSQVSQETKVSHKTNINMILVFEDLFRKYVAGK
jgi:DNA-binding CsgD family transcriptional regulator